MSVEILVIMEILEVTTKNCERVRKTQKGKENKKHRNERGHPLTQTNQKHYENTAGIETRASDKI